MNECDTLILYLCRAIPALYQFDICSHVRNLSPSLPSAGLWGKRKNGVIYHCAASGCLTHTCTHTHTHTHTHTEALGFIVPLWQMGCPLCTIGFDDALPLGLSLWNAHACTPTEEPLFDSVAHKMCVLGPYGLQLLNVQ